MSAFESVSFDAIVPAKGIESFAEDTFSITRHVLCIVAIATDSHGGPRFLERIEACSLRPPMIVSFPIVT